MATRLKFEVFDVYDQKDHKMNAIGQAQCQVLGLLMSVEQVLRLEVIYDGATCGYLIVKAWRVSKGVWPGCVAEGGKGWWQDRYKDVLMWGSEVERIRGVATCLCW